MVDLKKYLELIQLNLASSDVVGFELLKKIVSAHLYAFAYQNTDLFIQGRKSMQERVICPLNIDSIFEQMVMHHRPGYCFQNAELLAWALITMGFSVTKHLAKVINCFSDKIQQDQVDKDIVSHEVLVVELSGDHDRWLIDTGFANNSLRAPLAICLGEHEIAAEHYRLSSVSQAQENIMRLEIRMSQGWFCLYDFDNQAKSQEDIHEVNRQLFVNSQEPVIRALLKLGCVTGNGKRKSFVRRPGGSVSIFKSLSSIEKQYDLVPLESDIVITRHTFAVKLMDDNSLQYVVLDPSCAKMAKVTINGIITTDDLQKVIDTEQASLLFNNLQNDKAETDPLKALKPLLSSLLIITAERGHTHRREKNITSLDEFHRLTKEKFNVEPDEIMLQAFTL